MKKLLTYVLSAIVVLPAVAQLEITAIGSPVTIDFTGFMGSGFAPDPAADQLDSDTWAVTGLSDGDLDFGGTGVTGDFARGSTTGGVTTGGVYAADILGNQAIMIQPGADDFTPGSFVLRLQNASDVLIGELSVAYTLYILNDQGRSNSFNFSYSYDNVTWIDVTALDYTSGEAATFLPTIESRDGSIVGLIWNPGDFLYVRWKGDDVAGSGSRDEFALDDIAITAFEGEDIPIVSMDASTLEVTEDGGSVTVNISIDNDHDCTISVPLDLASTATNDVDFSYDPTTYVTFTEGGALTQSVLVPIIDDTEIESVESIMLSITVAAGTCVIGTSATTTIHITDNDEPVATLVDIAEVVAEDVEGVALSSGEYVTVAGIVYGYNLRSGGLEFTLIDETAGIKVFSFSETFGYTPNEGDELQLTGFITQFNGLTEIEPDSLMVLSTGNTLKVPTAVTTLSEATESDLITLDTCALVDALQWLGDGSSFNVDLTCEGGVSVVLRIDDLTDLSTAAAPTGTFQLTGIGGQYDTDAPYLDGYQIGPRYAADIVVNPVDTGTDMIHQAAAGGIAMYPNPVQEQLFVTTPGFVMDHVTISDFTGKMVAQYTINNTQGVLGMANLSSGIYYILIHSGAQVYGATLVKN